MKTPDPTPPTRAIAHHTDALLAAFRRAAQLPWYRRLLEEHNIPIDGVVDEATFAACPILTKRNTFERFAIDELTSVPVRELAGVLTSSGHGGRFSFGLISRPQARDGGRFIDLALDAAFAIDERATLAVNCLPMGVTFASEKMTVATTSVREDMAVALVETFGAHYDQVVIVADPLFVKRLLDYAASRGVRWPLYHPQVVLGEEIFGEHFRGYVAAALGLDADRPQGGYVMSSFGVGELGLHLCFETPATIALRRAIWRDPSLATEITGIASVAREGVPAILTYHPARTHLEVVDADADGYGALTVSMLDPDLPVPLLRYQTGDVVRLIDAAHVTGVLRRRGIGLPAPLPSSLLALRGRAREVLPDGSHVAVYKDALYADPAVAPHVTGAFRLVWAEGGAVMHVQLVRGASDGGMERRLLAGFPEEARPARVQCWEYERFPYGMSLDYERKFAYYAPDGNV